MSIGRFIFHMIMAAIFCFTAAIGPVIIDVLMIGVLAIIEIIAFLMLLVPGAGTFLFRITGVDALGDGHAIDVYLADGWLHKLITFVMINGIGAGIAGMIFSIPKEIRVVLGLALILFVITLSLKIDNAKVGYTDGQTLFSDFIPTILGLGIACFTVFRFTAAPTAVGVVLLCVTAAVFVARDVLALTKW